MNHNSHSKLISFIWSIADDCLRDVYVRGKYRDVILPMVVLRRLDTLLEDSKESVLDELDFQKNEMKFTEFDPTGLTKASGYVFYNTSKWTLRSLFDTATNNQQILLQNFEDYFRVQIFCSQQLQVLQEQLLVVESFPLSKPQR